MKKQTKTKKTPGSRELARNKQFDLDLKFVMDYARETLAPLVTEKLVPDIALGRWLLVYEDYLKGLFCVMDEDICVDVECDDIATLEKNCRECENGPCAMLFASYEEMVMCSLRMVQEQVFHLEKVEPEPDTETVS